MLIITIIINKNIKKRKWRKNNKSPLCHGLGNKLYMLHMEVLNIISFSDLFICFMQILKGQQLEHRKRSKTCSRWTLIRWRRSIISLLCRKQTTRLLIPFMFIIMNKFMYILLYLEIIYMCVHF